MNINAFYSILITILLCLPNCIFGQQPSSYYGINKELNKFFEQQFIPKMIREGDLAQNTLRRGGDFAADGLRPLGNGVTQKWKTSKIKLMFLFKDCHGKADTREFHLVKGLFIRRVSRLVYAFNKLSKDNYPDLNKVTNAHMYEAFNKYPHAYVNIKKKVGRSTVSAVEVKKYANRYKAQTLKEIDILKPNIILCGGTFQIAHESLFKDYQIEEICDQIYYSKNKNIIIIDSYHPTNRCSNEELYSKILNKFVKAVEVISNKYNRFTNI